LAFSRTGLLKELPTEAETAGVIAQRARLSERYTQALLRTSMHLCVYIVCMHPNIIAYLHDVFYFVYVWMYVYMHTAHTCNMNMRILTSVYGHVYVSGDDNGK